MGHKKIALVLAAALLFSIVAQSFPLAKADHAGPEHHFGEPLEVDTKIELGSLPHAVAVNPNTNMLYVTGSLSPSNVVYVVDGLTNNVVTTIELPYGVCDRKAIPDIAINPDNNMIYVYCWDSILVIDGQTNNVVAKINGGITRASVFFDPNTNKVYTKHMFGPVFVISGLTNTLEDKILICNRSSNEDCIADYDYADLFLRAVNPNNGLLYLTGKPIGSLAAGSVLVVNATSKTLIATIDFGGERDPTRPISLAVNPNTNMIYVGAHPRHLYVIDGSTHQVVYDIQDPFMEINDPRSIVVNTDNNLIYVDGWSTQRHREVLVIDGNNYSVIGHMLYNYDRGNCPGWTNGAFNPSTNTLYFAHESCNYVSVVDVSQFLPTPRPLVLDGEIIKRPLLVIKNNPPPEMVPGRTSYHSIGLTNHGTVEGQFLVLAGLNPILEPEIEKIGSIGDIEVVHSEKDLIVFSASIKPMESKFMTIPVKVPPEVVQFESEELQEGKQIRVGDKIVTGAMNELANLSPDAWSALRNNFKGTTLIDEAIKSSLQDEEAFFRYINSLKSERCGPDTNLEDCATSLSSETRKVAPKLADYVESLVIEPPGSIDVRVGAGSIENEGARELTVVVAPLDVQMNLVTLIQASLLQSQDDKPSVPKPHICPECNDSPAGFKISDHGLEFIMKWEGYAAKRGCNGGLCLEPCATSIDGKNCYYSDIKEAPYGFYNDESGYCTVGVGHLVDTEKVPPRSCEAIDKLDKNHPVRKHKDSLAKIKTKSDAVPLFRTDLGKFEKMVSDNVDVPLCQAQFDALVSFAFNVGQHKPENFLDSDLREHLNEGDYDAAARDFAKYNRSGGKVSDNLVKRRAQEASMFRSCFPGGGGCTKIVASIDPNHLYSDPSGYIRGDKTIKFTAMFENLANATAPAYDVKVVVNLDEKFNLGTFQNIAASHPDKLQDFTLDRDNRQAVWFFDEIALPPNKNPPEGEGWVSFSVQPKPDLATDTVLNSQAGIFFDFNPPIDTNVVEHIIDVDAPSTRVKSLNPEMPAEFEVEWEGSDRGSGISDVTIFVQKDGQQHELLDPTSDNKLQFTAEPDHRYSFVSVAVDNAGNIESMPLEADTSAFVKGPSICLIATAAFGSELTPQVQFLRNFRDERILSTAAGSSFMNVFNAWYYSFSPNVADAERGNPVLQQTIKQAIYPLLAILTVAEKGYSIFSGEAGAITAGFLASSMIGFVYLSPIAYGITRFTKGRIDYKLMLYAILISVAGVTAGILVGDSGLLMITTSAFVLISIGVSAIVSALLISSIRRKRP